MKLESMPVSKQPAALLMSLLILCSLACRSTFSLRVEGDPIAEVRSVYVLVSHRPGQLGPFEDASPEVDALLVDPGAFLAYLKLTVSQGGESAVFTVNDTHLQAERSPVSYYLDERQPGACEVLISQNAFDDYEYLSVAIVAVYPRSAGKKRRYEWITPTDLSDKNAIRAEIVPELKISAR